SRAPDDPATAHAAAATTQPTGAGTSSRPAAPLRTLKGHTDRVLAVAYSPDSTKAVSAARGREVIVWDLAAGQPLRRASGLEAEVTAAAFAPDGKHFALAGDDGIVRLFSVETARQVRSYDGHT